MNDWQKFVDGNRDQQKERDTGGRPVSKQFIVLEFCSRAAELIRASKKLERAHIGIKGGVIDRENLEDEFGDVLITLLLLADAFGVNLLEAAIRKFNKTSIKHGFKTTIDWKGKEND